MIIMSKSENLSIALVSDLFFVDNDLESTICPFKSLGNFYSKMGILEIFVNLVLATLGWIKIVLHMTVFVLQLHKSCPHLDKKFRPILDKSIFYETSLLFSALLMLFFYNSYLIS